ncbi:membrane cofactor protein [Pyxicephalus adspersus]|uniref:membrane cofactor protein n=1 Tax=Pyxicephalus adspersus TaxID=30357 RepID=UPI003B596D96
MISRRNYRECLPDNTWSNEAPVCEIQSCIPPYPIADGSFYPNKEEYEYQNTVTYQCSSKRFALIGESSVSCTVHGNWSSKPPECVVVECSSPNVDNAVKLSGFTGPYYFNNAVRFECLPKFTMNGSGLVKCNVRSQWEPPLPTCYSNVPAVMGNCIVILTLMLFGHLLGHHA